VSDFSLFEVAKIQVEDYLPMQASALGFFWLLSMELLARRQRPSRKVFTPELQADMFYWLFMPQVRVVSRILAMLLIVPGGIALGKEIDPRLLHGYGPLARQPAWLIVIELIVLMDLLTYCIHRIFHTVPFLWRFHALHHSARYIRWSTTGRVHPINEAINYLVTVVPLALVGFPVSIVLPVSPVVIAFAIGAHTQWNIGFGPLSSVFVSPRFHHWHHTHSHEGGNKNFANVFAFWDRLFGTYYLPAGRRPETFGLDVDDVPASYFGQLLYPFRGRAARPQPGPEAEQQPVAGVPLVRELERSDAP
jgi:sterol desaturase/sphingolipid hydroxylase (fatty acid hydroxylase superfamily)